MRRPVRVGEMDQKLWIDRRVETVTDGAVTHTWVPEVEVWARVEPSSANEYFSAMASQFKVSHRVTIRNRPSLTAQHRFRWNGLILNITGPLVPGTRESYLHVMCEAGVTDGT